MVERLLDAAEAEIVEHGSIEISLRAVARRAGVSHQAPGFAFTDREGLLTALAVRGYDLLDEAIINARDAAAGASGRERLVEMGVAYVRATSLRPAVFWLVARPDVGSSSADLAKARRKAVETLLAAVRDAMADGWQRDLPVNDLATLAWATVHGVAALHRHALVDLTSAPLEVTARNVLRAMVAD